MRTDGRAEDKMRKVNLTLGFSKFAEGSCLMEAGDTMVLCNTSVEEDLCRRGNMLLTQMQRRCLGGLK